jgi:hypothetical protein
MSGIAGATAAGVAEGVAAGGAAGAEVQPQARTAAAMRRQTSEVAVFIREMFEQG